MKTTTTIAELSAALAIDEYGLDEALLHQPDLYFRASQGSANAISERDWAIKQTAIAEAQAELSIRRKFSKLGQKLTEGEIKARVRTHSDVIAATKVENEARKNAAIWQSTERSFDQRMSALKKLVDLYVNNYYQSSGLGGASGSMKDHDALIAKRGMAQQRRKR